MAKKINTSLPISLILPARQASPITTRSAPRALGKIDLDNGNIAPLGVGLRAGEREALGAIANELGCARNALSRAALRWFIREYAAGRIRQADLFVVEQTTSVKIR